MGEIISGHNSNEWMMDAILWTDPYLIAVGEARQWRSGVISRTNSPVRHRQRHTLELPPSHLVWLSLELWDSDVSSAENAQGRCVLPVAQLLRANGPVEVELGRDSPRQSVGGNVCIELRSMVVESASLDSALLVEQAGEGGSSRCEDCVRFGELCEQADAAPGAVGVGISPNEMLEVRRAAYLERGEEKREALVRLLFAPDGVAAESAVCSEASIRPRPLESCKPMSRTSTPSACQAVVGVARQYDRVALSQAEAAGESHPSSYLLHLPSRLLSARQGDKSAAGSGGVLLLQLLPSTEVSLLFSAASHGTGATSICAQLGQRLSFAIANAERAGTPLLPVLEEQASSAELASLAKRLAGEIVRTASLVIESLPLERSSEDKRGERRVGRRESWEGGATNWEGRRLCGDGRGPMEEANKWLAFDPANEWARLRAMSGHSRLDGPRFDTSPVLISSPDLFANRCAERERKEALPSDSWRRSDANLEYHLCSSYPASILVPACVDDELLRACSKFRSKGRIPCLTWLHPNGAALCRSSQPLSGLGDRRCMEDEQLLQAVCESNPSGKPMVIADCRSRVATLGNAAMGKGTESEAHYPA
ncbi:MAG: hypothetical protein SGPRY_007353, partial [Prymnesium sp.]